MDFINRMPDIDDDSYFADSIKEDYIEESQNEEITEAESKIENEEAENDQKEESKQEEEKLDEEIEEKVEEKIEEVEEKKIKEEEKGTAVEYSVKLFDELLNIYINRKGRRNIKSSFLTIYSRKELLIYSFSKIDLYISNFMLKSNWKY